MAATEARHVRRDEQPWSRLVEWRGLGGLEVLCVQLVCSSGSPGLEIGWVEAVVASSDILAQALVGRVREELRVGHIVPLCHPGGVSTDSHTVQGEGCLGSSTPPLVTDDHCGGGHCSDILDITDY